MNMGKDLVPHHTETSPAGFLWPLLW